jgi:hypothetical protein
MHFPALLPHVSSKRFLFPGYTSALVIHSLHIYKWHFYLTIMVSVKNGMFRIYLLNVFIHMPDNEVEQMRGGTQDLQILW